MTREKSMGLNEFLEFWMSNNSSILPSSFLGSLSRHRIQRKNSSLSGFWSDSSIYLFILFISTIGLKESKDSILSLYMPLAHLFFLSSFLPPLLPLPLPPPKFIESSLSLALWNFTIMWISMGSFSLTLQVSGWIFSVWKCIYGFYLPVYFFYIANSPHIYTWCSLAIGLFKIYETF